ncbi:MAG: long-chain fatty acid--CoA ligase [Minicystis sp.]
MSSEKYENLVDMFERSVKTFGSRELFGTKTNGQWVWTSYAEVGKLVEEFRGGLASLGIKQGDCVAIISNNRVEWAVAAYACYGLGAALVPMYEAQLSKEWAFIINDCKAVAVITATDEIHAKITELRGDIPSVQHLIGLSLPKSDPASYAALLEAGQKTPVPSIHPDGKATSCLIYTSGTTGNPKGVILSHDNLISNINAVQSILPLSSDDRSLSFLPWAHSFGHTCELHCMLSRGASMALCEAVDKIVANLAEVEPTVLMSVPRIFNRIYDNVNKQMAEKPSAVRNLFHAGLKAANKQKKGGKLGLMEKITLSLASKIVFKKIVAKFGGRLRYAFSGGAALSREVAEFVDGLGITVYEGYGLTETSPIATVNRPGGHRIGSVGQPLPGVKIVIDKAASGDPKHGEIVVYGPNVMVGYHNRDEENKAVFTDDKGFRTGDLGYVDDDGFLYITGRIKEQYKLENGKYVAPAPLEEYLKLSPFIINAMIYGDNKLYNVALIVPDMEALKKWAAAQNISADSDDKLLENAKVKEHMQSEVDKASGEFKGFERVKRVSLIAEDFTTQNGMLTPSLKVKRRVVWQKYGPQIEALYAGEKGASKSASASAN